MESNSEMYVVVYHGLSTVYILTDEAMTPFSSIESAQAKIDHFQKYEKLQDAEIFRLVEVE